MTPTYGLRTHAVLEEVGQERGRQDEKWGVIQRIANGTGRSLRPFISSTYLMLLNRARHENDHGDATFESVLREEFIEAMVEDDPAKLRAELLQVAAVAVKWVEHIDRRSARL